MTKEIIHTKNAPAPIGPYSQATTAENILFLSGQVALIPGTDQFADENISVETKQVMENISAVLSASGCSFNDVVKTTIFLSDMNLFSEVNEIYGTFFSGNYPARETVAVKGLPKNARVEISMIAIKNNS